MVDALSVQPGSKDSDCLLEFAGRDAVWVSAEFGEVGEFANFDAANLVFTEQVPRGVGRDRIHRFVDGDALVNPKRPARLVAVSRFPIGSGGVK